MTSTGPDRESLDVLGKALSCWSRKFRLVCGHCYRQVRCDMKSGEYMNADAHRRAALKFWRQGWRVAEVPVCPTCQKADRKGTDAGGKRCQEPLF